MLLPTAEFFARLPGEWVVQRKIISGADHRELELVATFVVLDTLSLHYRETGVLQTNQSEFVFYREYEYCFDPVKDSISVYFSANRQRGGLFNTLIFAASGLAIARHVCGEDEYEAKYSFWVDQVDCFEVEYWVKGPHKGYWVGNWFGRRALTGDTG